MTQIRSLRVATIQPGVLGIHSLDRFALSVPDLSEAKDFYDAFGLDVRVEGESLHLYTQGHRHCWGSVREGASKKVEHLSFGAFEEDFARFAGRLEELGVRRLDPPPGFESNGLWFHDHEGRLVEIRVAEKSSPDEKIPPQMPSAPDGARNAPLRSQVAPTKPRRLAHILLFTSDVEKAIAFYSRVLGLRLSDRAGSDIAFMHGVHGSDHHMVAFARSDRPGLHHTSWDVGSVQEIGAGAMQMADKGFAEGWGLGRHVLGSNYFHYIRDPWGSYSEYSCDMDYIPAGIEWEADDHKAEDAFYVWGPNPPADFAINKET